MLKERKVDSDDIDEITQIIIILEEYDYILRVQESIEKLSQGGLNET